MKNQDDHDARLASLFSAARRADTASAPDFGATLRRDRTAGKPGLSPMTVRPAFLAVAGSLAVAAVALWLGSLTLRTNTPTIGSTPYVTAAPNRAAGPTALERGTESTTSALSDPRADGGTPTVESGPAPGDGLAALGYVGHEPPQPTPPESDVVAALGAPAPDNPRSPVPSRSEPSPAPPLQASTQESQSPQDVYASRLDAEQRKVENLAEATQLYASVIGGPPGPDAEAGHQPPTSRPSAERLRQLESELAHLSTRYSTNHPDVKKKLQELKQAAELDSSRAPVAPPPVMLSSKANERVRETSAQVNELQRASAQFRRALALAVEPEVHDEPEYSTEAYALIQENEFLSVPENPLSTFSIDVDTASYTNVRRFLDQGQLPPRDAVRVEELINYFKYDYPLPDGDAPFSAGVEIAGCPWNAEHRLARIGLKGREVDRGKYRGSNLVFLIDVSGSMRPPNKLPLVKSALALLAEQLDGRDQVAIVVYAGSSGVVLPSTPGAAKSEILDALDRLEAGGSTNGGSGLRLAYGIARDNFIPGGINRVILATDGDFNVGVSSKAELLRLIERDARDGIFLTTLGVGAGNYKDDTLEMLADRGNGNYAYIDSLKEARRVLVEEIGGTLVTIAKDVKIQVEFNPLQVGAYRLIGYENRMLSKEDFNDDRKDAGEIGSGHTVTALYELVPPDKVRSAPSVDPLKYQQPAETSEAAGGGELLTLKLRYKEPDRDKSRLLTFPVTDDGRALDEASTDFKFAAAVAMFGMVLRDSPQRGEASLDRVLALSLEGMQRDDRGLRAEFHELVNQAVEAYGKETTE
jgi:Ca-activated chloride channel family protein